MYLLKHLHSKYKNLFKISLIHLTPTTCVNLIGLNYKS